MKRLLYAFVTFSMINFLVFLCLAFWLGGDALNGKTEEGHYFLSSHGKLTEVSKSVFTYSKWHAISLAASWPFVMLSAWWLNRRHPQPIAAWLPKWLYKYTK